MPKVLEYLDATGGRPFGAWFDSLPPDAAAKVASAMGRLAGGNFSQVKGVGTGVYEYTLDFGPGYRIYFGEDGAQLIVLLAGGTKKRQQQDIDTAHVRWADYKRRKKMESP
jgi:putative addiction module killer protein